MPNYIIRLDDACEIRDIEKWDIMESLLDRYNIKPLVGIIPHCEDSMMLEYTIDNNFWNRVNEWIRKGWTIALHGYNHVYSTSCGGLNPVNNRSEFAGEPLYIQKEKIRKGIEIMHEHGINPQVFFAPSHTFDKNTIIALMEESDIRIISDTIANKPYSKYGMTFVPQQSGKVRKLPFKITTFCYHPNMMTENDFYVLERFIMLNRDSFIEFPISVERRHRTLFDKVLSVMYFIKRGNKK